MSDFRFETEQATSLRHKISNNIRNAILSGKLKPGNKIKELDLVKQMGVSRGPIREALRMLEKEGIINSNPYKDTMVADISSEEAIDVLIPIRLIIEVYAIRKALPSLNQTHVDVLSRIVDEMKVGASQNNLLMVVQSDLNFHEYLLTLSNLPSLHGIWTTIYNRIRLQIIHDGKKYNDLNQLWKNHVNLLETIKRKQIDEICAELTVHIQDAIQNEPPASL